MADKRSVEVCDFGVAAIIETKFDKRRTVIGTLHWMAPELLDPHVSYGTEVDIWAFGSMAYEMAFGFPPNATMHIDMPQFGSYLKEHCPRLEGDQNSSELKDLVASCMEIDPARWLRIEQIQEHRYVRNTRTVYPTESLSGLLTSYQQWKSQGGIRHSLFSSAGAQGPEAGSTPLSWRFEDAEEDDMGLGTVNDIDAIGLGKPVQKPSPASRRRQPPNVQAPPPPLAKVFDPNTKTNYDGLVRDVYHKDPPTASEPREPPAASDPLLRDLNDLTVRESLIDLDASLGGGRLEEFVSCDAEHTIRPRPGSTMDTADSIRHRTQDWVFPLHRPSSAEAIRDEIHPQYGAAAHTGIRSSTATLINLDDSLVPGQTDVNSFTSTPLTISAGSEFSQDRFCLDAQEPNDTVQQVTAFTAPQSAQEINPLDCNPSSSECPDIPLDSSWAGLAGGMPLQPPPPNERVMQGQGSQEEVKAELQRMIKSLGAHLRASGTALSDMRAVQNNKLNDTVAPPHCQAYQVTA